MHEQDSLERAMKALLVKPDDPDFAAQLRRRTSAVRRRRFLVRAALAFGVFLVAAIWLYLFRAGVTGVLDALTARLSDGGTVAGAPVALLAAAFFIGGVALLAARR